jgi:hypothetical protein
MLPFDHAMSPDDRQVPWLLDPRHLDESYRLGYRATDELLDERAAEVLDGLRLLRRKAKLAEEAAKLMGSMPSTLWCGPSVCRRVLISQSMSLPIPWPL